MLQSTEIYQYLLFLQKNDVATQKINRPFTDSTVIFVTVVTAE